MKSRLLFLLAICFFSLTAFGTRPQTKNYSAAFFVKEMVCDSQNLWVATWGGLVKYDLVTHQMTHYDCGNSGIVSNCINSVVLDSSGTVIAGRAYGGLSIFDGVHWSHIDTTSSGDQIISISQMIKGDQGKIYISLGFKNSLYQHQGIGIYQNGQVDLIPNPPISQATGIAIDNQGNLYFGYNAGLMKYDGTTWTVLDSTNSPFPTNAVRVLGKGLTGEIWLSISGSLSGIIASYDGTNLNYISNGSAGNATQADHVFANASDSLLYFYGYNMLGVSKYDGTNFTFTTPLPSAQRVQTFAIDGSGKWYMGTSDYNSCMMHVDDGGTVTHTSLNHYEMATNYAESIEIGNGNKKYFSMVDQFYESDGLTVTPIVIPSGLGNFVHGKMLIDGVGNLWFRDKLIDNGQSYNIGIYDGSSWTVLPENASDIAIDQSGRIWLATTGLEVYDQGMLQELTAGVPGFPLNNIMQLAIDTRGDFWINDAGRIYKYDSLNLTIIDAGNSPLFYTPTSIGGTDAYGNVWFSYQGNQIFRYDGSTWTAYDSSNSSLPGTISVLCVQTDKLGNVWLGTNAGLLFFTGTNFITYDQFNSGIGYPLIYDIAFDESNNAWVCSWLDGITVFNEAEINYSSVVSSWPASAEGYVFLDANQDGVKDSGDYTMNNQRVALLPDSVIQITGYDGKYRFDKKPGSYEVAYNPPVNWALTSDSSSWHFELDTANVCCYNFGAQSLLLSPEIDLDFVSSIARCNRIASFYINVTNNGGSVINADIVLHPDPLLLINSIVPTPDYVTSDSIGWTASNLLPFAHQIFSFTAYVPPIMGDTLVSTVQVFYSANHSLLGNDTLLNIIACSVDPNDKVAQPIGVDSAHYTNTDEAIEYTIHFENSGNDTAFYIAVRDTLNPALDLSTFEVVSSSHPMQVTLMPDGAVSFVMENVELPYHSIDELGSQGYIKYRIKAKSNTPDFTRITNTAHIFFDLNSDVTTNATWNTMTRHFPIGVEELSVKNRFELFPNPSTQQATIRSIDKNTGPVKIFLLDLSGRRIDQFAMSSDRMNIEPREELHGMFILEFVDRTGRVIDHKKWIIQ